MSLLAYSAAARRLLQRTEHENLDREGLGSWLRRHIRFPFAQIIGTFGFTGMAYSTHWNRATVMLAAAFTLALWVAGIRNYYWPVRSTRPP